MFNPPYGGNNVGIICLGRDSLPDTGAAMQDAAMTLRLGATVHQEGDLRVVEVLDAAPGSDTVIGFTVDGPGIQPLFIHPEVSGAIAELHRIAVGWTPMPRTRG